MRLEEIYLNDFADEQIKNSKKKNIIRHYYEENAKVTEIEIVSNKNEFNKCKGNYITIECKNDHHNEKIIKKYLLKLLRKNGFNKNTHILVVGLGNDSYLSDALGPKVIKKINVTSHLKSIYKNLVIVSCFVPSVMGVTGLESSEMIKSIVKEFKIDMVIVIDSLATRDINRLYKTYQITDTGINPGSGINNHRKAINKNVLKVPVIAIGVATVVDSASLIINTLDSIDKNLIKTIDADKLVKAIYRKDNNFVLTSKEIDTLIDIIADNVSSGINLSLNPTFSINDRIR